MKPVIRLQDAYKKVTDDQDKITTPEETVKRVKSRLDEIDLDILQKTVRIDNGRLDIPVYFSRCGVDAVNVIGNRKQMGKGATVAQAEASAVAELVERFSFFSFIRNPDNFLTATPGELAEKSDHPVTAYEYIARSVHDLGEAEGKEAAAAKKLYDNLPMRWARGTNLTRGEAVLIPFDWFYALNEFNGPSAGNCVEEAVSQGICEIVERHVSSIVSREKLKVPAISEQSSTQRRVREMLEKYEKAGIRLFLSDFSLDTGIPTVGVMAYDPETFPEKSEIVWTAGTTPDPQKALSRALTETAQLAGDFNAGSNYVASGLPKFTTLPDAEFITGTPPTRSIFDLPDLSDDNIRVEVENMTAALSSRGMEVFLIDTRHPDIDIPAFYTIIPGAHFRERAAGAGVGMFAAKLILEKHPPRIALEKLNRVDPALADKYYMHFYKGLAHLRLENPENALNAFSRALKQHPDTEDLAAIYSYMGVCYKNLDQYEQALAVLEKGASLDAERTDIHNLMGVCRFKQNDYAGAIRCFERVLALNPSSAMDYANIGVNCERLGEFEKAVEHYQKALLIDPGIEFARQNLEGLIAGLAEK